MYEIGTATTYHDTIRIGVRFHGRNGLRKPAQRETGANNTYHLALLVSECLAVAGHHLIRIGRHVVIHVGLRPTRVL